MALPEPNIQVFPFEPLKYMYGYVSYIENLKLVPKGPKGRNWNMQGIWNLLRSWTFQITICLDQSLLKFVFFLNYDLSYKNFSGRIPSSTQLQSFDALSYVGNPQLCGDPLPKNCTIEEESLNRSPIGIAEDDYKFQLPSRTWRHSYFRFSDDIRDWIYVTTVIKLNWLLKSKESALVSERRWHWFSGSCSSKGQKELFAKDIS
ncbi:receptor-like protein eix2 [Quercus suber]|uniref:Receptor-like protein eix2 n=1 Tax=Quercus suber TaxID=58331 RepID=A0AAW0JK29_QUESU